MGRWLSRDPIEEEGGINLYAFGKNNSICNIDFLGNNLYDLWKKKKHEQIPKAYGINAGFLAGLKIKTGEGAGVSSVMVFFPDSCEIAYYSVAAQEGKKLTGTEKIEGKRYDFYGLNYTIGVSAELAVFVGNPNPGSANADSFAGIFHTIQYGGPGPGVSGYIGEPYDDLYNSRWIGGTLGLGVGFGLSYVDWDYTLIKAIKLDAEYWGGDKNYKKAIPDLAAGICACYAMIGALP